MAVLHPDKKEFEALLNEPGVVFVDFFADWCGPCKMLAPELDKLAVEFDGKAKIVKINVDKDGELAMKYGVSSIPALFVLKDGQVVVKDLGFKPYPALVDMLNKAL